MTTAFQRNAFQDNAFQIDALSDTHDGFDATEINKKLDGQREERDAERLKRREHLRELLEAAFAEDVPAPVAEAIRTVAAPAVKRLESGRITVDYAMLERQALDARISDFRQAFMREQQAMEEDDEDAILLMGSLH